MNQALMHSLDGMELLQSEREALERRFTNMTAKEGLLFRGALELEHPQSAEQVIQIAGNLDQYQLFYGAGTDAALGRFVMEHIHSPTSIARAYLDPETVGEAYRQRENGCYVAGHYVQRQDSIPTTAEPKSVKDLLASGDYAIRIKLASRNDMDGVWIGFPDAAEYMNAAYPDELLLGLDALGAETLEQCIAVEVDCTLPQLTDLLSQYESTGELVRHAIDFGYIWEERGQGQPHWLDKWQSVMELENCHRLDLALDLAQNLRCYEFMPCEMDLSQYGMELAKRDGVLENDEFLKSCFDAASYAQAHMNQFGMSLVNHGYVERNGQEVIYEYSQSQQGPQMTM